MIVLQHESPPFHPESPTIPTSVSVATEPSGILPLSPRRLCEEQQETPLEIAENERLIPEPVLGDICGPLSCNLCNITLNSAQQARAHYQGKNHIRKLRSHSAASTGLVSSGLFPLVESLSAGDTAPQAPPMASSKHGGRVILATENDYCKLCDASFSSPVVAQAHYQGKNHTKRLRLAEASNHSLLDSSEKKTTKEGNAYKVGHGRRHVSAGHDKTAPYWSPCTRQQIPRDLSMCVTPSGQFYCSMCNVGASEEVEFRQHLESKPHKSKVSEQRYRNEMENLGYL